jgi:DMSO/TMAO reductase YedYZ heme-binding membrane subunit
MVKRDVTDPAIYATMLAVLLGYRVFAKLKERRRRGSRPSPRPAVQTR